MSPLQLRRPLLSIPKTEPRGRSGARLSTTRRSIQPKNKPLGNGSLALVCVCGCRYEMMKCQIYLGDSQKTLQNPPWASDSAHNNPKVFQPKSTNKVQFFMSVCWLKWALLPRLLFKNNLCCLLHHLSPDWPLSLCSVLMFQNKETLLDCEGETQPLTLPLHPATACPHPPFLLIFFICNLTC